MNQVQLCDTLAERTGLTKKQVESVIEALEAVVIETLRAGGEVTLTGFGAFVARRREARAGVNPRNPSERIQIPTVTVAKFRTGKNLKSALKNA